MEEYLSQNETTEEICNNIYKNYKKEIMHKVICKTPKEDLGDVEFCFDIQLLETATKIAQGDLKIITYKKLVNNLILLIQRRLIDNQRKLKAQKRNPEELLYSDTIKKLEGKNIYTKNNIKKNSILHTSTYGNVDIMNCELKIFLQEVLNDEEYKIITLLMAGFTRAEIKSNLHIGSTAICNIIKKLKQEDFSVIHFNNSIWDNIQNDYYNNLIYPNET